MSQPYSDDVPFFNPYRKFGKTDLDPEDRFMDGKTYNPAPFEVEYALFSTNMVAVEEALKELFDSQKIRVDKFNSPKFAREFANVGAVHAVLAVECAARACGVETIARICSSTFFENNKDFFQKCMNLTVSESQLEMRLDKAENIRTDLSDIDGEARASMSAADEELEVLRLGLPTGTTVTAVWAIGTVVAGSGSAEMASLFAGRVYLFGLETFIPALIGAAVALGLVYGIGRAWRLFSVRDFGPRSQALPLTDVDSGRLPATAERADCHELSLMLPWRPDRFRVSDRIALLRRKFSEEEAGSNIRLKLRARPTKWSRRREIKMKFQNDISDKFVILE